jgi:hypothetical protein
MQKRSPAPGTLARRRKSSRSALALTECYSTNILFEMPRRSGTLVVGDIDYGALLEKLMPLQSKIDRQISVVWMRPEEFHTADRTAFIREVLAGPLRVLAGQVEQG